MSIPSKLLTTCALGMLASGVSAVEPRLRLGPHEATAEVGIVSKHVDNGVTRIDEPSGYASLSARVFNIGLSADAFVALADDGGPDIQGGEVGHIRARVDYLIEIPGVLQIMPHYETSTFPATGKSFTGQGNQRRVAIESINPFNRRTRVANPHYVGVDAWYLLPWEGMEVGGGISYDIAEKVGWKAAVGARQFIQIGTLDLAFYELVNFSDSDHRDWTIGVQRSGISTAEAGVTATLPLPFEYLYVSFHLSGHYWLDSTSRRAMDRSGFLVGGASFSFRTTDLGL